MNTNLKQAIITPTFRGHFSYIKAYLQSFDKYLLDRDLPIFFIINSDEQDEFEQITNEYTRKLNIKVIHFERILRHFGIFDSPDYLLKKYGRLSFQTLKKLYAGLYIRSEWFLFLDSESMLIKETNVSDLFNSYKSNPTFFLSRISDRVPEYQDGFTFEFLDAVSHVLHEKLDFWPIESYEWFYSIKILDDLVKELGAPIEIVKAYKCPGKFKNVEGILEAVLYYSYIYARNEKYRYNIKIIEDELQHFLGAEVYTSLKNKFDHSEFNLCGFLECLMFFISKDSQKGFTNFLNYYNFHILRVETSLSRDFRAQKFVIDHSHICICPSSQNHLFGINSNLRNRWRWIVFRTPQFELFLSTVKLALQPLIWAKNVFLLIPRLIRVLPLILRNAGLLFKE